MRYTHAKDAWEGGNRCMPGTAEQAMTLFYSYAHEDEALREQLEKHLSLLQQQGFIAGWNDRLIRPGVDWAQEIDMYLNTAHIILMLVSPDFMASQYCIGIEMKRALERFKLGEARVIPIILRPIDWETAPFSMLQALPTGGKPVQSAHWHSPDEAFADTAKGIRMVVQELRAGVALAPERKPAQFWHVPYRRNPLFTGREDLLQQIHERFTISNSGNTIALSQSQAISGLGGIGKTQTALEYAYRYRQEYRAVLWVSAASEEALQADLIKLASVLGLAELPGSHDQEPQRLLAAIKAWLTEQRDWLLILDNADDLAMTYAYLPESGTNNGHILLTTRAQAGGHHIRIVPVEQMSQVEGALLLLRRAKVLTPEEPLELASAKCRSEAEAIVAELGGLPLAIDQAGAYLEETGSILSSYLDLYCVRRKELLRRRSTLPSEHPEPVATTWSLSFQRVEEANRAAADLLRLCAFLHPDAIPEAMLVEGGEHLGPVLAPLMADPYALNVAIEELRKFSLIRRNAAAGLLSLHRLVQAVLKDGMEKKVQQRWAKRTVMLVNAAFPTVDFTTWERCQLYLPHALACASLIETYRFTFKEAAGLLSQAGRYLREQGLYGQAEPLFQSALAIREKVLGPEHPDTATSLNNLAWLYREQGQHEQAEPLYQRALAIREKVLGPEHPDTAISLGNLASLYQDQGKYQQAEPLYQRALAIREQRLGPDHPRTATTLYGLAFLYQSQGKYQQAAFPARLVYR